MANQLLRVQQVAEILNLKPRTIYEWIRLKKITVIRIKGRAVRIPKSEVERMQSVDMAVEPNYEEKPL